MTFRPILARREAHNPHRLGTAAAKEKHMLFSGVLTAIVTPFKNGDVDEEAFRSAVRSGVGPGRAYGLGMLLLKR